MATIRPFRGKAPKVHEAAFLVESALLIGDVELGEASSVWFGAILRGDVNAIRVGARTNIQDLSVVHVTSHTHPTVVGDDVTVGHRVTLHGCTVGDRCLVGIGSSVMDGAVLEDDCMVGAGSLVPPRMVVPSRTLVVGVPARVARELNADEIAHLRASAARYVQYAQEYRAEGWSSR